MRTPRTTEWPTLVIVALCYTLFVLATVITPGYSLLAATLLLAITIALHSSLQHEVLHGHPFPKQWMSDFLVFPAIGLIFPFERFRKSHLDHHMDSNLTDPYDDPESNYLAPERWNKLGRLSRVLLKFNNTLLGRMLVGPAIGTSAFIYNDILSMLRGDKDIIRAYALHALGLVPVVWWMNIVATIPFWAYLIAAYGGLSLLKIRTFLEHRANESVPGRTAVIEDQGPLAFLFLNNNYHAVHHMHPHIPWYALPKQYTALRSFYLAHNEHYVYKGYIEIFWRYLFKAKDPVPHPLMKSDSDARKN